MVVEVRPARDRDERAAALDVRREVFCAEQGVSEEEEVDGRDEEAVHLVAVERATVVGTCRVLIEGETAKLGRMAVLRRARGLGSGRALLKAAEREARSAGARRVVLHAQLAVAGLYGAQGYAERGAPFREAGIDHVAMEKRLA